MRRNYRRVLPRDLFNEAKLLKCLGKFTLLVLDRLAPESISVTNYTTPVTGFLIVQTNCGHLCVTNIGVSINGTSVELYTPYNSKEPWPLLLSHKDELVEVFTNEGEFDPEFLEYVKSIE